MKKSNLYIAMMAMMFASCSQDETLEVASRQAITFGDAFIENATRAIDKSYDKSNMFDAFDVYGTITNSKNEKANLFKQETVTNKGDQWGYSEANTQYWIPGNTYNFVAVVDGNKKDITNVTSDQYGMPETITLYDASEQLDILWAKLDNPIEYQGGTASPVSFTFNHLMAKAMVTVKNEMTTNSGYSYKVKDVTMVKTPQKARYSVADKKWYSHKADKNYQAKFGNIVAESNENGAEATFIEYGNGYSTNWSQLFIPIEDELQFSFTQELYRSEVLIDTKKVTVKSNKIEFKPGHAYNFLIILGNPGDPIKFTVSDTGINGWETGKNDKQLN